MKKISLCGSILLMFFIGSCTTSRSAITTPPVHISAIPESVIRRVKENSPEIKKEILLDENKNIIVRAELYDAPAAGKKGAVPAAGRFEVVYDMEHAEADGAGGLTIPFMVSYPEDGLAVKDQLKWKPQKDAAGILLAFDDNYTESWEHNFDLFDQHNARVTFFIQGEICPFCALALTRGHDVGYHTINHLNLPKVSRETFFEETISQIDVFREAGIPLTSFAYPFGLSETWMNEELLKTFTVLRGYGVTYRVYERESIRQGYSSSKALDNILFKQDEEFKALVDLMLRALKFTGGNLILPLTTHDISDTADWGIKPGRLKYLLQTANDLQLIFYRYKDL